MMRVGIVCDCHNTLILSNDAWIKAFLDYSSTENREKIEKCLYGKCKRRLLANELNIEFSELETRVRLYSKKNDELISLLELFKQIGVPLFVVSNAPSRRVLKDITELKIDYLFEHIYTGDDGGKRNTEIFDEILRKYHLEKLLFIGNEEFDDHIVHPQVVSVVLSEYLLKRYKILGDGFNELMLKYMN